MKCPTCEGTLEELMAGDVHLDICRKGCGGVWFDRDELFAFDEGHEFDVSSLLDAIHERTVTHVDHDKIRTCPKCPNEPLVRQFFDIKNEVEIDQCWKCAGVWLDPGEIDQIRSQFETHADRVKASDEYIVQELKTAYSAMQKDAQRDLAEMQRRYDRNPLARSLGFFQRLLGVEGKTDSLLNEQVFSADFDKLLEE